MQLRFINNTLPTYKLPQYQSTYLLVAFTRYLCTQRRSNNNYGIQLRRFLSLLNLNAFNIPIKDNSIIQINSNQLFNLHITLKFKIKNKSYIVEQNIKLYVHISFFNTNKSITKDDHIKFYHRLKYYLVNNSNLLHLEQFKSLDGWIVNTINILDKS
jgi:hypothetical protein